MTLRACACRVLLTLACLSVASGFAQPVVLETLFDEVPGFARAPRKSFKLNSKAAAAMGGKHEPFQLKNFPLANGATAGFDLAPVDLFDVDSKVVLVEQSGTTSSITLPAATAWYGRDISGGKRNLVLVSRSDGSMSAMVTGDPKTSDTVVMPDATGATYAVSAAVLPERELCAVGEYVASDSITGASAPEAEMAALQTAELTAGARQVDLMLDVSYVTYQKLGSDVNKVSDYVTQLMAAVGSIYRRDLNVELRISSLYIWKTADTFNSNKGSDGVLDTGDQLNAYQAYVRANRGGVNRDLAHLINYNRSLGGIAYVDALCEQEYGIGVSNVYAELTFPGDISQYHWDTMVVSHEMGHNFGSPHTHSFDPPIDCCYVDSTSKCSKAAPSIGTIMSYCHLSMGSGGGINMKFHDRCVSLIRSKIEAAQCLSIFNPNATLAVKSDTGMMIAAGSTVPSTSNGTMLAAVDVGSALVTRTYTLANDGSKNLVLSGGVALSGSHQLRVSAQPAVLSLAPGASTTFAVTFDPAVEGLHNGQISLSTNDPAAPTYAFAISGSAVRRAEPQTFYYTGNAAIPDNSAAGVTVTVPVSGVEGPVMDIDFAIEGSQCSDARYVGLQHTYVGDLKIVLESPTGKQVVIMDRPGPGTWGSSGDNFCGTIFDDEAGGPSIEAISATGTGQLASPHSGTFTAAQPLSVFYGEPAAGTWKIHVSDMASSYGGGIFRNASLRITGARPIGTSSINDCMSY